MTARILQHGRRWLAGFLAAVTMVGWSVAMPDSAAAKDACSPERAETASSVTPSTVPNTAAFGSGTIAYNRQRPDGSRAGIWVADADGANPERVADSGSRPVWSPDGSRIAYEEPVSGGVWVMDADGANRQRLTEGSSPVWSPDGSRIAYEELDDGGVWVADDGGVWVADADGANRERLTEGWGPVWSPDGNRVAYNDGGIWTMDADGANARLLAYAGSDPAWSPDGRRIVYYQSGPDRGVWVVDADSTNRRWLVGGSEPVWSPDGERIAYAENSVTVMDSDGANRRPVSDDSGWALSWSPGGSHLAYSTTCDGRSEVWVVDVASSESWLLAEGAYSPAWSPAPTTATGPSRSRPRDAWTLCPTFP